MENWRVQAPFAPPPALRRSALGMFPALLPALPQSYLWRPTPGVIPIVPGLTARLTGLPANENKVVPVSCVQIFADQLNAVTISIGPENLVVAAGARPNVAFVQLDAGRCLTVYTDDVLTEFFDLGTYFAAHGDGANTWFLYVTIYSPVNAA